MKNIRELPEFQRKLIFWTISILAGILAFSFWVVKSKKMLGSLENINPFKEIKAPSSPKFEQMEKKAQESLEELRAAEEMLKEEEAQEGQTLPENLEK